VKRTDAHPPLILLGSLFLGAPFPARGADDGYDARLRSMPREQRLYLAKKLQEFDALNPVERAAVRDLDQKLASLPEGDRENYYAVLRRYHLWLQGLSEAQRNEISSKPPALRMAAVSKIMKDQASRAAATPPFQTAAAAGPLIEQANSIKVWLALSKSEKEEVSRLEEPGRQGRLIQLGRQLKVVPVPRLTQWEQEEVQEKLGKKGMHQALKRFQDQVADKPVMKEARRRRLLEHAYYEEHTPAKVRPENLANFAAALPPFVRATLDPLPPDEARRRLTVFYRLLYPPGKEFQPPRPETATAAAAGTGAGATKPPAPPPAPTTSPTPAAPPAPPKPAAGSSPF
jgi:hypothetical protein